MSDRQSEKRTLIQVLCVAIPKIIGGLSQVAMSLVLIRVLGPAQFGMVSVGFASSLLLDSIIGSAIDMSVFRLAPFYQQSDPLRARQVEKAGILIKLIGGVFLAFPLIAVLKPLSSLLFQDENQGSLLLWTYSALLGLLMVRSLQSHFQVTGNYWRYAISDLLHSFFRFGAVASFIYMSIELTPGRIMAIYCAAASSVTVIGLLVWAYPIVSAPFSRSAFIELARPMVKYFPTVAAGTLASRSDMFFVSSWGGVLEAGIYGAAQMFTIVPQLLGSYISAVFSPKIIPMWREGKLTKVYLRYQLLLVLLSVLIFLGAWVLTGPLGSVVLPPSYVRSREVVLYLLPAGLAAMINFPLTIPLLLYAYPRVLLLIDLSSIPLLAISYWVAVPGHGATVAAMVTSLWAVLRLVLYQGLAFHLLRQDPEGRLWLVTEDDKSKHEEAQQTA